MTRGIRNYYQMRMNIKWGMINYCNAGINTTYSVFHKNVPQHIVFDGGISSIYIRMQRSCQVYIIYSDGGIRGSGVFIYYALHQIKI